jgi:hypothetical protein
VLAFPDATARVEGLLEREEALDRASVCPQKHDVGTAVGTLGDTFMGILPRPMAFHSLELLHHDVGIGANELQVPRAHGGGKYFA